MPEENVEIVRRLYPEARADLVSLLRDENLVESLKPLVHPRFEMVGAALATDAPGYATDRDLDRRTVYGIEGFVSGWRQFLAAWDAWMLRASEFIDLDYDRVLVRLDIQARSKTHRVEVPIDGANIVTVRDGKLFRVELFTTWSAALEAAGLSE